jgi:endonuclease-3
MAKPGYSVSEILHELETVYGSQSPTWPTDPYEFLVWWHCGYPASDERCAKGWQALINQIGIAPNALLAATPSKLAAALRSGGMVPELRAMRLKEIAARIKDEYGGDLRNALVGPINEARRTLKKFPNIADPGADRILLFAGLARVAAVPSNCPHVIVRVLHGRERENYGVTYREAQQILEDGVPKTNSARQQAYLLLKKHGQEICKSSKPKCDKCVLREWCAYFAGNYRGRSARV